MAARKSQRAKPPQLTPAEEQLAASAARGELCDLLSRFGTEQERIIRAEVLRDLCLKRHGWTVDPRGVRVKGAIFEHEVDLANCDIPFGLEFIQCEFRGGINLIHAKLVELALPACQVHMQLRADQIEVAGSVVLCDLHSYRRWWLHEIPNENDPNPPFEAREMVSFAGAKVGGQFSCDGGQFLGEGERCLFAQGIEVRESVFLRDGFKAQGRVDFSGAKVGRQFNCDGGQFLGKGERCLFAQRIEVGQSVFLRNGFKANGDVDMVGCRIKGGLYIEACQIAGAVKLLYASIDGTLLFAPSEVGGAIDLRDARIGEWDDRWAVSVDEPRLGRIKDWWWEWGFLQLPRQSSEQGAHGVENRGARPSDRFSRLRQYRLSGLTYNSVGEHLSEVAQKNPRAIGLWLALADGGRYDPQPYEQMARALKTHGQEDAYREVIIAKRVERRRRANMKPIFAFFDFLLLDVPVRYGYKPWRAILWGALICLVSWLVFARSVDLMVPAQGDILNTALAAREREAQQAPPQQREDIRKRPLHKYVPKEYPQFNPFYYTMDLLLPLIDLHHEAYWEVDRAAKWLLLWQGCVIISGWYLTTLFISSFTGLLRVE